MIEETSQQHQLSERGSFFYDASGFWGTSIGPNLENYVGIWLNPLFLGSSFKCLLVCYKLASPNALAFLWARFCTSFWSFGSLSVEVSGNTVGILSSAVMLLVKSIVQRAVQSCKKPCIIFQSKKPHLAAIWATSSNLPELPSTEGASTNGAERAQLFCLRSGVYIAG